MLDASSFLHLFQTAIPWPLAFVTILTACSMSVIVYLCCRKEAWQRHKIIGIWIIAYTFLMLYSTVIGRVSHESTSVFLMPFWSIGPIQDGSVATLYEKICNVLFFIPYGILVGLWYMAKGFRKSLVKAMAVGCLTSVGIELLQLITRTGTCETDDVICNTFGCLLGALIAIGIISTRKLILKKHIAK